jgi:dihydroneopterin aldolase
MRFNSLTLQDLVLTVHLGCTAEERALPQEVRVKLELRFPTGPMTLPITLPVALSSDKLEDTICYAKISYAIIKHCEAREYHLIERMAAEIYLLTREISGPEIELDITVHKVRPPVDQLRGGTFFRCGDFI